MDRRVAVHRKVLMAGCMGLVALTGCGSTSDSSGDAKLREQVADLEKQVAELASTTALASTTTAATATTTTPPPPDPYGGWSHPNPPAMPERLRTGSSHSRGRPRSRNRSPPTKKVRTTRTTSPPRSTTRRSASTSSKRSCERCRLRRAGTGSSTPLSGMNRATASGPGRS